MKRTVFILLTAVGVVAVLWLAGYIPYSGFYDFVLEDLWFRGMFRIPLTNLHRLEITSYVLIITVILAGLMFLLRMACRKLELRLFQIALTVGMFYVGTMTVLMLVGFWLDSGYHPPLGTWQEPSPRVGFFFYYWFNSIIIEKRYKGVPQEEVRDIPLKDLIFQGAGFLIWGVLASFNYSFLLSLALCGALLFSIQRRYIAPKIRVFGAISAGATLIPLIRIMVFFLTKWNDALYLFKHGAFPHGSSLYLWHKLWVSIEHILYPEAWQ